MYTVKPEDALKWGHSYIKDTYICPKGVRIVITMVYMYVLLCTCTRMCCYVHVHVHVCVVMYMLCTCTCIIVYYILISGNWDSFKTTLPKTTKTFS